MKKGFTLSLDLLFAIMVLIGILVYTGIGLQTTTTTLEKQIPMNTKQILDDALTALDNQGTIGQIFVDDTEEPMQTNTEAKKLYEALKTVLPANIAAKITITQYEPTGEIGTTEQAMIDCRNATTDKFNTCFTNPQAFDYGDTPPTLAETETYKTVQTFMKRQPYSRGETGECTLGPILETEEKEKQTKISLQGTIGVNTKVRVADNTGDFENNPLTGMNCYDATDGVSGNEIATVELGEKGGTRPPVAVMTIMDRSGSMSILDVKLKETNINSYNDGKCLTGGLSAACTAASTNCWFYGNWIENVGTINISTAFVAAMSGGDGTTSWPGDKLRIRIGPSAIKTGIGSYACAGPKIRILTELGGTEYYGNASVWLNNATNYVMAQKTMGAFPIHTGIWLVDLWAEKETTLLAPLFASIEKYGQATLNPENKTLIGIENAPPPCPVDESDWKEIGSFEINDLTYAEYSLQPYGAFITVNRGAGYPIEAQCGMNLRIKAPDGSYKTGSYSKVGTTNTISIGNGEAVPFGGSPYGSPTFNVTPLQKGTWKIEAWSEKTVTIGTTSVQTYFFVSKIEPITIPEYGTGPPETEHTYPVPNNYPTVYFDNGTCSATGLDYTVCFYNSSNCSAKDELTYQTIKSIANEPVSILVDKPLRALKANFDVGLYNGICTGPVFRMTGTGTTVQANGTTNRNYKSLCINRNITYNPDPTCWGCVKFCDSEKTIAKPIPQGNWDLTSWSDDLIETTFKDPNSGYTGPSKVTWYYSRIDTASIAGESFFENSGWKDDDLMGLLSYATTVPETPDVEINTFKNDPGNLVNKLWALQPDGETNIAGAIKKAKEELVAKSASYKKFAVLLTDGAANITADGIKCTDPLIDTRCIEDAIQKADEARAAEITIYTIGFGIYFSGGRGIYEENLRNIAKDPCYAYDASGNCTSVRMIGENPKFPECFESYPTDLTIKADSYCGRYYYAADPEMLKKIYEEIAKEIGVTIPNTEITIPAIDGIELCKCSDSSCAECANSENWTTDSIAFSGFSIPSEYIHQYYKARVPCTGRYCIADKVIFPPNSTALGIPDEYPQNTTIFGTVDGLQTSFIWGQGTSCECSEPECTPSTCTKNVPFTYKDCNFAFISGVITPNVAVDFDIQCNFNLDPATLEIGFWKNGIPTVPSDPSMPQLEVSNPFSGTCPPETYCGTTDPFDFVVDKNLHWTGTITTGATNAFSNIGLSDGGYIYALMSGANECVRHNKGIIYCLEKSKIFFYKIEYEAWIK